MYFQLNFLLAASQICQQLLQHYLTGEVCQRRSWNGRRQWSQPIGGEVSLTVANLLKIWDYVNTLLESFLGLCEGACKWGHWNLNFFSFTISFLQCAQETSQALSASPVLWKTQGIVLDPLRRHVPQPSLLDCCKAMVDQGSSPWDCWLPKHQPLLGGSPSKPIWGF